MDALFRPNTIAIIGASRSPEKVGHQLVANLQRSGFAGTIVPVNPSAKDILGIPCYPDLRSFDGKIDLSVVVLPRKIVKQAVQESIDAGARALVIITAGFKEVGKEGARLEREIAELCRQNHVRLLGPNCLGLMNTHHGMDASFANKWPAKGTISVISQSGALMAAILDIAVQRKLGLSKLISIGNKADLSETDLISILAKDDETRVIVGYLESIDNGKRFIRTAQAAAAGKPLIIFKSGVTSAGVKAASSHTGSLAGADIAYGAAFRRSGVVRAETFEAMFDYATAFDMQPLPAGNRIAVITNAGGPGIMAADAVEQADLVMSALETDRATALAKVLPTAASVANPVDVLGDADADRYAQALASVQEDPAVDGVIVLLTPQAVSEPLATAEAIRDTADGKKPILTAFMGGDDVASARALLTEAGIPDYPSPSRAVDVMRAMCQYAAWLRRPPRVVTHFPVNRRRVERIVLRHLKTGQLQVGEPLAKDILRAYDFNVLPGQVCATSREAIETATRIGYPVAMKVFSPDIIHKSDMGGVRLGLDDADAVRDAFDLIMLRTREHAPDAHIEGVYVERMCKRGREVILGMTRDPQFGPMLMFGLGGIFVEVMKDVTFHIAPITQDEAMQMLRGTKSFALLQGVRGQASVDLKAIAVSLQRISQLVTDFPQIVEMDINPFMVGAPGTESVAADARITLSNEEETE